MGKSLKILFSPLDAIGHVNSAIAIAQVLITSGHKCVFVINDQWKGKLEKFGIEEELFTFADRALDGDPAAFWADLFVREGFFTPGYTLLKKMVNFDTIIMNVWLEQVKLSDPIIESAISRIQPDVIFVDHLVCIPSIVKSGIPWVWTCSLNPLFLIDSDKTPPRGSGYPALSNRNEWQRFRHEVNVRSYDMWKEFNNYVISRGVESLQTNKFFKSSPFMNIYGFPLELDYTDVRPLPPNHYRFDNLKRTVNEQKFTMPKQLTNKQGKLIYFSMGSMGGAVVSMMKRLVAILAKSKHRFIVSKGPLHSTYELADNMWGEGSVPQIQVLPIVDLVITHGGNNTVTETFYFGKPMIVLPLFVDQYDNAQRVEEKGFGLRLDPHLCTEEQLLTAIENLLNDNELSERLKTISKRIQKDNSISMLPILLENLLSLKQG